MSLISLIISDTCFLSFAPQIASEPFLPNTHNLFYFLFNLYLTSKCFTSVCLRFLLTISIAIKSQVMNHAQYFPGTPWAHLRILVVSLKSTSEVLHSKLGDCVWSGKYFLAVFPALSTTRIPFSSLCLFPHSCCLFAPISSHTQIHRAVYSPTLTENIIFSFLFCYPSFSILFFFSGLKSF